MFIPLLIHVQSTEAKSAIYFDWKLVVVSSYSNPEYNAAFPVQSLRQMALAKSVLLCGVTI